MRQQRGRAERHQHQGEYQPRCRGQFRCQRTTGYGNLSQRLTGFIRIGPPFGGNRRVARRDDRHDRNQQLGLHGQRQPWRHWNRRDRHQRHQLERSHRREQRVTPRRVQHGGNQQRGAERQHRSRHNHVRRHQHQRFQQRSGDGSTSASQRPTWRWIFDLWRG